MLDPITGREFSTDQQPDRLIPEFYLHAIQNNFKSEQEGRPVFDDVEKVRIIIPGDKHTRVEERVTDEHRQRWPRQYEAFKTGLEQSPEGFPIELWPPISPALALNLKALGIPTVEALSVVTDAALGNIGIGARELRAKAKAYLQQAEDGKPLIAALADKERLEGELVVRDKQIADLQAAVAQLQRSTQVPA